MDMGMQPYEVPVPDGYDEVFHCGFRTVPHMALHQFIAAQHGVHKPLAVQYEIPDRLPPTDHAYYIMAPRGESTWKQTFLEVPDKLPYPCYTIGAKGEDIGGNGIDMTGMSLLDTLWWLSYAKGFIGLGSSQLVLANGFPGLRKVVPHHGYEYDYRHFIYQAQNRIYITF
jgi:hypothetical protein